MKKIFLSLLILQVQFATSFSQSVIQQLVTPRGYEFRVLRLGPHINDGKYDQAINNQLGIIGNDYFKLDTIGTAPAEEKKVQDTWYPIALDKKNRISFKSTAVGIIKENYRRSPSEAADFASEVFVGKEADDDWNFDVVQQGTIVPKIDMYGRPANIRHDIVRYEIDVPDFFKDFFKETKEYTPAVFTPFAAYGPLVTDQGHGPPYAVEIHPAEQMWWTKQLPTTVIQYLFSLSDASRRFNDRDSYDANEVFGQDPTWKGMWQKIPQESIFAIPFFTNKKETENITIREITSFEIQEPILFAFDPAKYVRNWNLLRQSKMHTSDYFITYKKDTVLQVKFIGTTDPVFDINNFGFDPYYMLKHDDTAYKGFIVMKSSIKTSGGHQIYKVERKDKNQHLEKAPEYTFDFDINIKSISCEDLGDDIKANEPPSEKSIELTGEIGVVSQGINQNIGATIPLMNNNLLAAYTNKIILKQNETRNLNIRRSFKIHENEEFNLNVLFKEASDWTIPNSNLGGAFPNYITEPSEEIDADGATVRGAEFYFYNIGVPREFTIIAKGNHNTKIKLKGSLTVTNKVKLTAEANTDNIGK